MKRSNWLLRVLLLVLAIGLIPLLGACGGDDETTTTAGQTTSTSAAAQPAKTYKIGLINSLTGLMAPGLAQVSGSVPVVEAFVNSKGGITVDGQQYLIDIAVEDDMSTQDGAIAVAKKLISAHTKIIIAPQFPPYDQAITSVCEDAKILRFMSVAPDHQRYADSHYEFVAYSSGIGLKVVHDKILGLSPDVKKMAIVCPDDPPVADLVTAAMADFKERGLEIVFEERFPPDIQDFYPIMTKALAAEPDAISFVAGMAMWAKGILESARQMGFTGPVFASAALGDPNQINAMFDPRYANDFSAQLMDVHSPEVKPLVQELGQMAQDMGLEFQVDCVNTFNTFWIIKQAIEEAQSFDVDKIVSTLESMDSIETVCGPGKFVGEETVGHINIGKNRIMNTAVPWYRIMDAKVQFEWLPIPK